MAKINTVFNLTDNVSNRLRTINNTVNSSVMGFESMAGKLITVNSALDLLGKGLNLIKSTSSFLGKFISDASEYESLLVRLTVATGDAILAQEEFQKLKDFAKESPFDMPGVVQASIMFRNAGIEAEKLIPTIKMLGDVAQGNNDYFNRMAMNIAQIKAVGKATQMDIRQFGNIGVPMAKTLQEMGVTGTASFDDIMNALMRLTNKGGQFYNSMSSGANTSSGKVSNLRDAVQQLYATIGNTLLPTMKSLTTSMTDFVSQIDKLESFKKIIIVMEKYAVSFKQKLTSIVATVLYLGTIVTAVCGTMAVAWAVVNWPISLTIIAIITLIRAMSDAVSSANDASVAMNGFGNQCAYAGQAFGMTIGLIVGLISGLLNIVYNAFSVLYNIVATLAEFIANLFIHPIKAIEGLFINVATSVIDTLSLIAGAVDWVFGGVFNKALNDASEKLKKFKAENIANENYIKVNLFESGLMNLKDVKSMKEVMDNFGNMGYEIGLAFEKAFNSIQQPSSDSNGNENKYDSNGNLLVSDKNIVNLADDFRELLSKHATQKFNLNFSQVTPSVNVGGITVNNNADIDAIYDTIVSGVEDAQSSSLGG